MSAAACGGGDSSTGPRNADPTGLYSLRQVGGTAIPAEVFRGRLGTGVVGVLKATGGELVLQDDDRFYLALDFRLEANGETVTNTTSIEGEYEIEGGELTLTADDGVSWAQATLRNGVVVMGLDPIGDGSFKQYTFRYVP